MSKQFVEPFTVEDVFVSGVASVEWAGGKNLRFVHYSQRSEGGIPFYEITQKLVIPICSLANARILTEDAISRLAVFNAVERLIPVH
jgi:hypothetical protein